MNKQTLPSESSSLAHAEGCPAARTFLLHRCCFLLPLSASPGPLLWAVPEKDPVALSVDPKAQTMAGETNRSSWVSPGLLQPEIRGERTYRDSQGTSLEDVRLGW